MDDYETNVNLEGIPLKLIFVAHVRDLDKKVQTLWDHLREVSYLTGQFTEKIGLRKHGELIGLLHDIGKASREFNQYIRSATGLIGPNDSEYIDPKEKRGKIDHASAGAQIIHRYFSNKGSEYKFVLQILSLAIASHHSGLIDCLTIEGKDNYSKRMNKINEKTRFNEVVKNMDNSLKQKMDELMFDNDFAPCFIKKMRSLQEKKDSVETIKFKVGLLARLLFSCLIDADRLNTANFEFPKNEILRNQGNYVEWSILIDRLNIHLAKFEKNKSKSEKQKIVNSLRTRISNECMNYSEEKKDVYQLTVPTGGGKTLSSLRFALNHAKKHQMDRIIYVIPYTSIIDQNAETIRNILEIEQEDGTYIGDVVLEHHSNLTPEEETDRQKLLAENWDAPVVFTTMVQVLESLFGHGTRNSRRMHQLANAVLIFDEIQTLPIRCVHLFNIAVRFFIQGCNSTVVLCTATQPLLGKVKPIEKALQIAPRQEMMSDVSKLFEELKRVEVYDKCKLGGWTEDEIASLAKQELKLTGSVLIITNTKKSAKNLFSLLQDQPNTKRFHLSTNMCPIHRMEVLDKVKECLEANIPVICISTQLIEAGVDIDFGSVIRYLSGIDSIAQAAGRCNRNGARSQIGRVFIVNPKKENLDKLPDIKIGGNITTRILEEFKTDPEQFDNDIIGPKAIKRYYEYYFHDRAKEMKYEVDSKSSVGRADNLFNLLSANQISVQEYQRMNDNASPDLALCQSFMAAAKSFQSIDSSGRGIIVPYKEGKDIIYDLCASNELEKQYALLKKAQRYSINVFSYLFDELVEKEIIHEIQKGSGIFYLNDQYYSEDYGMSDSSVNEMEVLIYGGV
ncbi:MULTISPECIES: CRISPR-associated helicase/endonuclease Cas3 [Pelosinus]|uniref:CRISPR-associated helicase Cas3 n=1 Tax=Pelosinus fermentans B4 TaxID=1149862 RepID=I9LIQ9_9FIRM|nr:MULTISPECIES: CRISPR-associated helicase/endonuclease Cas3 [Pelosinus]EIW20399.1 CRISPR-associated helicase Cas3 [Pelosinus fermentans B4]EIW25542.1 metal dependent phosphohydrolase [Pelosinus fermentans A11]OAM93264.1 CRISPR-associated helicase Cas3 [Pelosinus fermentans DSM 17108]SDQ72097.1 CRISPR-associated helicase, Cas3 family [Pelosinus fermentans]